MLRLILHCSHLTILILSLITITASAAPRTYPDGHGGEVAFPQGDISFADEVVHYDTGSEEPIEEARDPEAALGIPDYDKAHNRNFVSLGCGGELILKFTDNVLIDVPGPDLYVFEIGPQVEPTALAISRDGEDWVRIGSISGGKAEVDIGPYVKPGDEFRYVRLVDLEEGCGGKWPGADIDAVGAIGSARQITLDSAVLFDTGKHELKPAASSAIGQAVAEVDVDQLESVVVAGHTDSVGSAESNMTLSENRARAVVEYLVNQAGFPEDRLHVEAHGEDEPVADNTTAAGRARNRRVELTLRMQQREEAAADSAPVEIIGVWSVGRYGILEMQRDEDDAITGVYRLDNGRLEGRFTSDTVLEGYWIEDRSRQACDSERDGSRHWGRLRIEFESAERGSFKAKWAYCEEEDWSGSWPDGRRVL